MLIKTLCLSIIFFAVALYAQGLWIRLMRGNNIGEAIKDYGPSGHRKKRGTPGMGGIVAYALAPFAAIALFRCGLAGRGDALVIWSFPLMAGLVGLTDDLLKWLRRSSEGLRSLQKLSLQVIVCCAWAGLAVRNGIYLVPGVQLPAAVGASALVFIAVCVLNAVNVTDGLDGLAGGMAAISLLSVFMWSRSGAVSSSAALGIALSMAFLWHNSNPAGLFMGDIGSHFWGGLLISLCVAAKSLVYIVPMGFLFGVELVTSAIQIASIRGFNRKVFRMSPLHHHFELSGMSEPQIVARFMIAHAAGIAVIMIVLETIIRGGWGNV